MATPSTRAKRQIIGPLHAIRGPTIRTGCSSPRAADKRLSAANGARHILALAAVGFLTLTLVRDTGPRRGELRPIGFNELSGWTEDRLSAAIPVFLRSCAQYLIRNATAPLDAATKNADFGRVADWRSLCQGAEALPPGDDVAARRFFEAEFVPFAVADQGAVAGLVTGYYEIELNGSRRRHGRYQTPIYRKPPDVAAQPLLTRAEIEDGALSGRGLELLWVDDPIDAFFLESQGSGRVRLVSGETVRVGYDGKN